MHIRIQGLGPHTDTTVEIGDGLTEIDGPSEAGKSTLIDAVAFVWWGTDRTGSPLSVDSIRDGVAAVEVELSDGGGTTYRRRMTRSRSITREIRAGDVTRRVGTEAEWSAELGLVGDRAATLPLLAPMAWAAMATSAGGGRELRDYLATTLGADAAAWLAERLEEGEPTTEKGAETWRRDAKKAAAEAAGAVRARREALEEVLAAAPAPVDHDAAEAARARIAKARAEQEAHRDALRTAEANRETVNAAKRARDGWEIRLARLPGRPDAPRPAPGAIAEAADRLREATATGDRARREHDAAVLAHRDTVRRHAAAREAAGARVETLARAAELAGRVPCRGTMLHALTSDDADPVPVDCGTCPLLTDAVAARAELPDARAAVTEARALVTPPEPSSAALEEARAAFLASREAHAALVAAEDAWSRHEAAHAALGDEPTVPDLDTTPPPAPVAVDPADEQLIRDADAAQRLAADHEDRVLSASKAVDFAGLAALSADHTAARAEEVVRLVRSAPGEVLRERLAGLDAGPLTIEVPDADAPDAIRVLIDGRPWVLASTGRRIVADLAFRAALRAAGPRGGVPLFVDEAQSVGGQALPSVDGPVVVMRTTDADTLAVHAAAPQRAA